MESYYRVRLKLKTKLNLFFILTLVLVTVTGGLWLLVNSQLFKQTDLIEYRNYTIVKPVSIRKHGKFGYYDKRARFKTTSDKFIEMKIIDESIRKEKICIVEVYTNGVKSGYASVSFNNCNK